ncbi:MAG TPA: hypothetical protein VF092_31560 [Longimicrobium sp.]
MNPVSRVFRWIGGGATAAKLRRHARRTADPAERVTLLERSVALDDLPTTRMELAVAAARCGLLDTAAANWRRAVEMRPLLLPSEADLAALAPVLPLVAKDLLAAMTGGRKGFLEHHWKLERRGSFDGEERWKVEQEEQPTMRDLLPTLRLIALAVAHTAAAPGRVRIDCDLYVNDSDLYNPVSQMGEAIIAWDAERGLTDVAINE